MTGARRSSPVARGWGSRCPLSSAKEATPSLVQCPALTYPMAGFTVCATNSSHSSNKYFAGETSRDRRELCKPRLPALKQLGNSMPPATGHHTEGTGPSPLKLRLQPPKKCLF